jgi:hypothetical protein
MKVTFEKTYLTCRYLGMENSKGKIEPICPVAIGDFDTENMFDSLSRGDYLGQATLFIANNNIDILTDNDLESLIASELNRDGSNIFLKLYVSQKILNDICIGSTGESEADSLGKNPEWILLPECFGITSIPCEISTEDYEGKRLIGWNGRLLIIGMI